MKMTPEQKAAREQKLLERYGGPEGLAKKRKEWQAKSRKNYSGNGGFRALSPERRKEIASAGGKAFQEKYGNKLKKVYEAAD